MGQRGGRPPRAVGLVWPCRPKGPQALLRGRFRRAPKSSHKTSWTSSSWSMETCASIAASLDANAATVWEKSCPNEAQGWDIRLGGCSCPGVVPRVSGADGLITFSWHHRAQYRGNGMQEYSSVSAGPGGWYRTSSSLKSPEALHPGGAEAELRQRWMGTPIPHTPHFELCLHGSVTCRSRRTDRHRRKSISRNYEQPFCCFSCD